MTDESTYIHPETTERLSEYTLNVLLEIGEDPTRDGLITNSTKELVVEENPVETSISLDNLVEGEYVDFYSIDGRLLKSVEADSTKMSISLSGIPSGINIVRNANRSVRFIKK